MSSAVTTRPLAHPTPGSETPVGVAAVLPGRAYPVHLPVLAVPAATLAAAGWFVQVVDWDASDLDGSTAHAFVRSAAELAFAQAPAHERRLVVGKSLGSLATPWTRARGIPGIWLTPLLREPAVVAGLAPGGPPGLLVGGTADVHAWDGEAARATGLDVLELDGLDHGLAEHGAQDPPDAALRQLRGAVADFAARL